jgi:hypothetical protein
MSGLKEVQARGFHLLPVSHTMKGWATYKLEEKIKYVFQARVVD